MLLQAYDFLRAATTATAAPCRSAAAISGATSWPGCDLIRRVRGARRTAWCCPLVTTSAGHEVRQDRSRARCGSMPKRTSPYRFYQFWLNDRRPRRGAVPEVVHPADRAGDRRDREAHEAAPEKREAQRELAREVTRIVHGDDELRRAERASAVIFGGNLADADPADILMVFDDVPSIDVPAAAIDGDGLPVADAAVRASLVASKGEAARLIRQGGILRERPARHRGRESHHESGYDRGTGAGAPQRPARASCDSPDHLIHGSARNQPPLRSFGVDISQADL